MQGNWKVQHIYTLEEKSVNKNCLWEQLDNKFNKVFRASIINMLKD